MSDPFITIGGKEWTIPPLAARQNRIVDPLILSLLPVFAEWQQSKATALGKIGQRQYDDLLEISFVAITRAHPEMKKDAFLDLPVTLPELVSAFAVVAQQTGVFKRGAPGEAQGEESSPTGTK